ncbi:MAG TPA: hypothetical protein DCG28_05575 [Lachnospiraceae bacterium]|nr:hypothetical protein [Lachnospiraceae bacterium]
MLIIKIILYLLLFLVVVIMLSLGVVLFVPIRYRCKASVGKNDFSLEAEASWLLRLFSLKGELNKDGVDLKFKFPFYKEEETEDTAAVEITDTENETEDESYIFFDDEEGVNVTTEEEKFTPEEKTESEPTLEESELNKPVSEEKTEAEPTLEESEKEELRSEEEPEEEKLDFDSYETEYEPEFEKEKRSKIHFSFEEIVSTVSNFFKSISDKYKSFKKSITAKKNKIVSKIDYIKNIDYRFGIKDMLGITLDTLLKLVKSLGLKRVDIDALVSLDRPDKTGMLLAAIAVIQPHIPGKVNVTSDFSDIGIEGEFAFYGRVFIIALLLPLISYVFSPIMRPFLWYLWKGDKKKNE